MSVASKKIENVVAIDAAAKAAEIEAIETANAAKLAAHNTARAEFFRGMATLGALDREGKQSPYKASIKFQDAVRDGFIKATSDEAREAYKAYSGDTSGNVVGVDKVTNTLASQTANLLTFGLPAAVHAGEAFYEQIDGVIGYYASADLYGAKIKCYAKANRELNKIFTIKFKELAGDTYGALRDAMTATTDALIATWLVKEGAKKDGEGEGEGEGEGKAEKAKRTPLEQLDAARKILDKLVKDNVFPDNSDILRIKKDVAWVYHGLARVDNR